MAKEEVTVKLSADGTQLETGLAKAGESIKRFGRTVNNQAGAFAGLDAAALATGSRLTNVADKLAGLGEKMQGLSRDMAQALSGVARAGIEFEHSMRNVNSIAKESEKAFASTSDEVVRMASSLKVGKGPKELADALYDINSSGFSGKEGLTVLAASAKAAAAGLADTKSSAGVIVDSLNSYRLGAENAGRVSDILFKTVDKGKISFQELSQYLGEATGVGATFGISFEELNAGIAVLTARGIKAPQAVNSLRQAILQLAAPTGEAQEAMKAYGIHVDAAILRSKGLNYALQEIFKRAGASPIALRKILGEGNVVNAMAVLQSDKGKQFGETTQGNIDSSGATDTALNQQRQALAMQLDQLKVDLEAAAIGISKELLPIGKAIVATVGSVVDAFNNLPGPVKATVGVVAGASVAFLGLTGTLLTFAPAFVAVQTLFASGAIATASASIGGALSALAIPAGIAVAAIGTLYLAWKNNWGGIQETTASVASSVWTTLKDGFEYLRTELPRIWEDTWQSLRFSFIRLSIELQPAVREVTSFLVSAWATVGPPLMALAKVTIPALQVAFYSAFIVIREVFGIFWEVIKGIVSTVWPLISGIILGALDLIGGAITAFLKLISGDWSGAWESMKQAMSAAFSRILPALKASLGNLVDALKSIGVQFVSAGEAMIDGLINGINNKRNPLMEAIKRLKAEANSAINETGALVKDITAVKDENGQVKLQYGPAYFKSPTVPPGRLPPPPEPTRYDPNAANKAYDKSKGAAPLKAPAADYDKVTPTGKTPKKPPKTELQVLLDLQKQQFSGASVTGVFNEWREAGGSRAKAGRHNGYDIAMPAGTPVAAAWPGRVTAVVPWVNGEFGITVTGGGRTTTYGHLTPAVREGQEISSGSPLGKVAKDHVDVKMKDSKTGKFIDYGKELAKSQTKGLADDFAKSVREYVDNGPYANSPTARLEKASREHDAQRVKAATPEDRLAVDRRYAQDKRKLELEISNDEAAIEAKRRQDLLAAYGDTQGMELEKIRETARLRRVEIQKQLEEDLATKPQQAETLKANASQQMANVDEAKNQAIREAETKFEQELPGFIQKRIDALKQADTVLQGTFQTNARLREEHKLTLQGQLDADATALNSYIGTEEGKQQARIQYGELFKQHLDEQLQLTTEDNTVTLQRYLDSALLLDQTLVANQVQVSVIQDALRAARLAKMQTEKAQILAIGQQLAGSFENFLVGVTTGQVKFNEGFKSLWQSITQTVIKYVAEMIIKVLALQKIMSSAFSFVTGGLGGIFGGVLGGLGSMTTGFGLPDIVSNFPIAHTGGLVVPGGIQVLHSGGFAGLDVRPDEVLAKLQVGEMVLSRSQVEAARQGGSTRSEQPGVYSPISFSGPVYIREEADIDRLANAIAQRQREEWQAW